MYQGIFDERVAILSPRDRETGIATACSKPKGHARSWKSLSMARKLVLRPLHEVHLVYREHDAAHAHKLENGSVAAGLALDSSARIDEQDRHVGVRGAGRHVARVLLVAGAIDDDVAAVWVSK